ncbi:MAG: AAA family ATPase [Gemmatimonadota bacterium]
MLPEPSVVCPVLIGRDAPLSAAFHTLDRARESHGSTLLVSGDAGIGKSRLIRATVARGRELGFVALEGACFEADRAQPYAPLLDLVRGLATTTSPALAAHYFSPAADALVTLFPELRSLFPAAIARDARDPEEDRRLLFHDVSEALLALSAVQPLLMVIEDVHWSDEATLDLLLHLSRRIGSAPIALVLTFRSDEVESRLARLLADLDRARGAAEVLLRPLGESDVAEMLQVIFGSMPTPGPSFVAALYALTEGNPFFVEEMLKALLVSGDLVRSDGAWRASPLEHVHVPRTATEAVARRLAGLSDGARAVASVAAVAGRRFDFAMVQALTGRDEAGLLVLMKELVAAQLVVEESADRFAFRHALTREAMRARLLTRERAALHRAIAALLGQQFDPATHEVEDALAYHAFEAGQWEVARTYARRAAEHALTLSAPREALQQFDRAVVATERLGAQPDADLLIARGRAHEIVGAFPQAHDDFTAALEAARAAGERRGVWGAQLALGMLWAARDYERAGEHRRAALTVARAIGDPALIARSLNRVGNWHVNREEPHAGLPYHDEALAIFEAGGDARGVAETVDLVAMTHHIAGAQATAGMHYERSIKLFRALDDRRGLSNALSVLAVSGPSHHASAGTVHESVHLADILDEERPIRIAMDIGWRAGEAFARAMLADCLAWRGDYPRALALARESLAIAEELQHLEWQCAARRALGLIALDVFAHAEALRQLEAAHDIARRLASATWTRWTGATLATGLARSGDAAGARAVLDEVQRLVPSTAGVASLAVSPDATRAALPTLGERALALARGLAALAAGDWEAALAVVGEGDVEQDTAGGIPCVLLVRAQALTGLARWADAHATLGAARREAERQGARPLAWRIEAAQGRVHLGLRRRVEARRAFDAARALAQALAEPLNEPALLDRFEIALAREAPASPSRSKAQTAKAAHGGLTKRERDAAALIADGLSNRAIARSLGIGERTVEGYVAAALAKLGFSSRAQIAVWASEQGLTVRASSTGRSRR